MKYLDIVGAIGSTFGLLFMPNIAGTGNDSSTMKFIGVAFVSGTLIIMRKTLMRQGAEIERLKKIVGTPMGAEAAIPGVDL